MYLYLHIHVSVFAYTCICICIQVYVYLYLHIRVSVYESNIVNFTGPIFKNCPFHKFIFFPEVKERCYKLISRSWFYKGMETLLIRVCCHVLSNMIYPGFGKHISSKRSSFAEYCMYFIAKKS